MQIGPMIPVRVFFQKFGAIKYVAHLDTMRAMTRAFRRSGLHFWYTQGFNPHLYMTFALPISLGYESLCESVDLRLTEDVGFEQVKQRLNASMPNGLAILHVAAPVMDAASIAWADYDVTLRYHNADTAALLGKLEELLRQPSLEVQKRAKKGDKLVDIRPMMQSAEAKADGDTLSLKLRLAAGNTVNINPGLLLGAFYERCNLQPDSVKVVRTHIFDNHLTKFH